MSFFKAFFVFILDIVETFITALTIFALLYLFLFVPHQVRGNSMEPNFTNSENLLTNKIAYRFKPPKRGDVIVFKSPQNIKFDYIKRIIGLPEEKISLKENHFYINDKLLDESPYLASDVPTKGNLFLPEGGSLEIPLNQYFVAGDNRNHSSDSREWGFVPKENIIGRAWFSYWPATRLGFIPTIAW